MITQSLSAIGVVRKTHGYDGELKLSLDREYREALSGVEFLFIGEDADTAIPYGLISRRGADDIVRLKGVESKEAAERLRGCSVFARVDEVGSPPTEPADSPVEDHAAAKAYARFVGFAVIDDAVGEIGAIASVEAFPGQTLANVDYEGRRRLVPLTAELIRGVDFTKKIVFMDLPAGILNL